MDAADMKLSSSLKALTQLMLLVGFIVWPGHQLDSG